MIAFYPTRKKAAHESFYTTKKHYLIFFKKGCFFRSSLRVKVKNLYAAEI